MKRELSEQHRDLLESSRISTQVASERGYWTAILKAELETLGFKRSQCSVPALVIPIRDVGGRLVNYQIRPDQPRIDDTGRPVKYESPAGIPPTLDVPPRCRERLQSQHFPLWITEGARKADAAASAGLCCVSLPGVWSWAKRLNGDARQVLPDLQRIRFEDVWGDEFLIEPEAFFDLGEYTLAFTVVRARGRQSGAAARIPAAQVLRWRDGLCVNFKAYAHREDALKELGVSEDALEPIAP